MSKEQTRVLLVDDEEQLVTTMAKRLRRRGFIVLEAVNGLTELIELRLRDGSHRAKARAGAV